MDIGSVAIGNVFSVNGEEFLKVRPLPQFPDNVTAVKLLTGELIVYPSSSTLCRTPEDDAIDAIIIEKGGEKKMKQLRPSLIPTMLVWMEYPTNKPSRTGRYLCANTVSYTPSFFIRFWNQEHQEWTPTVTNEDVEYWADVDAYEIKALGDY